MDNLPGIILGFLAISAGLYYGITRNLMTRERPTLSDEEREKRRQYWKKVAEEERLHPSPPSPPPPKKPMFDPVREITAIFEQAVGDFHSGHIGSIDVGSVSSIVVAGYAPDSQIWRQWVSFQSLSPEDHKKFVKFMNQEFLFWEIFMHKRTPAEHIAVCFDVLREMDAVIRKCRSLKIYDSERATVMMGVLLCNFASSAFPKSTLKRAYWKNSAFVEFYTVRWNAYEDLKKQRAMLDKMSKEELLKSLQS